MVGSLSHNFSMIGEGVSRGVSHIQYSVKYGGFSPLTCDIMPQARKNLVQKSMHTTGPLSITCQISPWKGLSINFTEIGIFICSHTHPIYETGRNLARESEPIVCTSEPNFTGINGLCHPLWARNIKFDWFWYIWITTPLLFKGEEFDVQQEPMMFSSVPYFMLISASCSSCKVRKCKFEQILNFCWLLYPLLFSNRGEIWQRQWTKFHLDQCVVSPLRGKNSEFYQSLNIRGSPTPFWVFGAGLPTLVQQSGGKFVSYTDLCSNTSCFLNKLKLWGCCV